MSEKPRLLPVYPFPLERADLDVLREAKDSLNLGYQIQPCEPVLGYHRFILAMRTPPPFIDIQAAIVKDPTNINSMRGALQAVLSEEEDPRLWDALDQLRAVLGPDVQEVVDERIEQRVRFD